MDKKSIVLGSGDLYITEFTDGAELPSNEDWAILKVARPLSIRQPLQKLKTI